MKKLWNKWKGDILSKEIFGYRYDNETGQYVIHEKEAKVVRAIYDLYGNYTLNEEEITDLFNGNKTIINIIINRINNLKQIMKRYNKKINIDIDDPVLLQENKKFQKDIIDLLIKSKTKIKKINSSIVGPLLNDVDDIVTLISKQDELYDKYGDFQCFNMSNYQKDHNELTH